MTKSDQQAVAKAAKDYLSEIKPAALRRSVKVHKSFGSIQTVAELREGAAIALRMAVGAALGMQF